MNVTRFKAADAIEIELQDAQAPWAVSVATFADCVIQRGDGYTVRDGARILACGGVIDAAPDVGVCWSLIARGAGRQLIALHRIAARLFETCGKSRLVATAECDFTAGCRWLELLGFKRDENNPAHGFGPDGRDHFIYVRAA